MDPLEPKPAGKETTSSTLFYLNKQWHISFPYILVLFLSLIQLWRSSSDMASPTRRVLLPEPVEQLLEKIWTEKGLTTNLEETVRLRLASIGEEEALHLLNKVSNVSSTIRNPIAYIERMIDNHSPSPTTPAKRLTVSPLQNHSPSTSFVSSNNVRTVPSFHSPKSELPEPSRTALIPHAINPPRQGDREINVPFFSLSFHFSLFLISLCFWFYLTFVQVRLLFYMRIRSC